MEDLVLTLGNVSFDALSDAMRAVFGDRISGISHHAEKVTVHFYEAYTEQDVLDAQAVLDAHDPVLITAARNGNDVVVFLTKPHNLDDVTELTLTIDGESAPDAAVLVSNVGTDTIESADTITIGIAEDYPHQEVTI